MTRTPPLLAICVLGVACARTVPPSGPVRLRYTVGDEADDCPDAAVLRRRVEERLGYDPWSNDAPRAIEAVVAARGRSLAALIELTNASGKVVGHRALEAAAHECPDLLEAMALAISLAIDPVTANLRAQAPARKKKRWRPIIGAGGGLSLGAAPRAAATTRLLLGLRWPKISLNVEGRFDLPASDQVGGNAGIGSWLAGGSLLGCGHHHWIFGCGVLTAAALRGEGRELVDARAETLPYLATGLRVGSLVDLGDHWSLQLHAELLAALVRPTLTDNANTVEFWQAPIPAGGFGLALVASLW